MTGESSPPATHSSDQHARFWQALASPPGRPERRIAAWSCDGQPPCARHRRMACFVSPLNSPPGTDT